MENSRRYREKKRSNAEEWIGWKEKERERIMRYRQSATTVQHLNHPNYLERATKEERKNNAERQRKSRANQKYKIEHPGVLETPYKTNQLLYRAVNRVREALPKHIDRKRMELNQLFKEFYPEAAAEIKRNERQARRNHNKVQRQKVADYKIIQFYQRNDITYQTPGKSDVISVKIEGKRTIMQKRYMIMTLGEAYRVYCNEIGNEQVGKSKFCELRPQNIMVVADTPHTVCVCQFHSNFNNLCSSLKSLHGFPKDLLTELCCDLSNESCMISQCKNCETNVEDVLPLLFDYEVNIFWKKWEKTSKMEEFN